MLNFSSETGDYFDLKPQNEHLAKENAILRERITALEEKFSEQTKVDSLTIIPAIDSLHQYRYYQAKVVNNAIHHQANYITINKGTKDGIKPEMAVICAEGVVGRVVSCSKNYSTVMSLLNQNYYQNVRFQKGKQFGILHWNGDDRYLADLNSISKHVIVNKGDTVVSNTFDGIFPENVLVGTVEELSVNEADQFYQISIRLSTDFNALSTVYVIENTLREEQIELEGNVSE